ncbi:tyrosine-type recombinase/integrase [Azospirillum melinis]|uniref:Tyrosine-type recombinase/integrase n=1 Tax=Azospirillum melinis TaxID=328839 RepID=A0ABX2KNX3_9PROT|nr:site-specific integrase [Azospirillum melinis]MBP2305982.1 site-specific recombinase XerD [Azospirillum melinis]NUB03488.1 tyrosine-type recombinase/integrase [Azospirillum melinis]
MPLPVYPLFMPPDSTADMERAHDYAAMARSPSTLRAYAADLRDFERYCRRQGEAVLPATSPTVAAYLAFLADQGRRVATLERRLAAISQAHQLAGFPSPTADAHVRSVFKGIRRHHGSAPRPKAPIMIEDLRAMVAALPDRPRGIRDRALLLLGFAGGFRRSELTGLTRADVEFCRDGLIVTLRRSKTDQEGEGRRVAIPYGSWPQTCPVRAIQDWLSAAGIKEGAIFRSVSRKGFIRQSMTPQSVSLIVKQAAKEAGLDSLSFAGHSLRAGLCTSAAQAGVSERAIMNQTGHRSTATLRRYIRDGNLFTDNAATRLGL